MYHYVECGLPNIYLANGYHYEDTPYGRAVAIEDVESLHAVIARDLVENKPFLTGPEVRFVRKYLNLTQAKLAEIVGTQAQTVRRWEKLARVPKQADRAVRMVFRDMTDAPKTPLDELIAQLSRSGAAAPEFNYRYQDDWRLDQRELA